MRSQFLACLLLVAFAVCIAFPQEPDIFNEATETIVKIENSTDGGFLADHQPVVKKSSPSPLRRFMDKLTTSALQETIQHQRSDDEVTRDPEMIIFPPSFMCVAVKPGHETLPLESQTEITPEGEVRPKRYCTKRTDTA